MPPDKPLQLLAVKDLGRVAAQVLASPEEFVGKPAKGTLSGLDCFDRLAQRPCTCLELLSTLLSNPRGDSGVFCKDKTLQELYVRNVI